MPTEWVKMHLRRLSDITRHKEHSLKVDRAYIPKPNGKKRPIGAPRPGDKGGTKGVHRRNAIGSLAVVGLKSIVRETYIAD